MGDSPPSPSQLPSPGRGQAVVPKHKAGLRIGPLALYPGSEIRQCPIQTPKCRGGAQGAEQLEGRRNDKAAPAPHLGPPVRGWSGRPGSVLTTSWGQCCHPTSQITNVTVRLDISMASTRRGVSRSRQETRSPSLWLPSLPPASLHGPVWLQRTDQDEFNLLLGGHVMENEPVN